MLLILKFLFYLYFRIVDIITCLNHFHNNVNYK